MIFVINNLKYDTDKMELMGDFYKLMSRTQRTDLLELYEGLFNKTITIVKKKMIIKDRSQQESTWEVA